MTKYPCELIQDLLPLYHVNNRVPPNSDHIALGDVFLILRVILKPETVAGLAGAVHEPTLFLIYHIFRQDYGSGTQR